MKFVIAFGIFRAKVKMEEEYDPDTKEFRDEVIKRLKKAGFDIKEVEAT